MQGGMATEVRKQAGREGVVPLFLERGNDDKRKLKKN